MPETLDSHELKEAAVLGVHIVAVDEGGGSALEWLLL
jgi:hypothetical protein